MPKAKPVVWVSDCMKGLQERDFVLPAFRAKEYERLTPIQNKHKRGETLTGDEVPTMALGHYPDHVRLPRPPHLFTVNTLLVVSDEFRAACDGFDLGAGGFTPIALYWGDGTTRMDGDWFFLNLGCRKNAFAPEESERGFRAFEGKAAGTFQLFVPKDNDIAVTSVALEGCELWVDERILGGLFVSAPLVASLKAAKVTRTMGARKCRVVGA